ncbi:tRNA pseudouridine(38-40) synthase TruA [Psychroserpens sp.]|uniref:tRNA pseudouridine(38-40) synthase TruA n=1 Tax=Psychroserpens sp. TaxID=2020870 RepID=UPI001B06EEF5|nr:tRNA pseudouridine(38-40) synthase TruA [Psychroserpens sp.]MBO6607665.1 tRNA pseudouridine(38-40) synthase TruA [Psychroserpens sp.]MBO6631428.1 tRNA pseudouridine(38-40) synthase TruA [Psychroserpens sp.]MBO6655023.1 tRNA pseudouridine(38-40) synthase TruA [Psychroserpens sp.]MBO6683172.1 tRNA pseudouridine(38-40) synthase TruA [Psychroserpens sp.]MBO6749649.1 tRNA pseudouridine(38-40) synthase TruA [Psychroserpens sp.]
MRYFIELSYNGKAYHGWQNQPNAISVQQTIEEALSILLKEQISIMGAGRTDAGVHASKMFAHFDMTSSLDDNLVFKLNSYLPKDIAIHVIFEVKSDAHARFDATSRTYNYRIALRKDVFNHDFAYALHKPLDLDLMNEACEILLSYKDFQCFSKSNTDVKTYHCDIKEANWTILKNELVFTIKADRFLRNMVRAIVGTLINIGLNKIPLQSLHDIIKSKDRSRAGYSVPAHGLYLIDIEYPEHIKKISE